MKILLVEDNEKLSQALKKGLVQEGYAVDALADGEAAERRILTHRADYDLVILDVMLPGKNGLAVCKFWRQQNITLPVLMLTAKDTTGDKILGLDSGADDYMVKPFSFEELLARVRALLRRPKQVLPVELSLAGISLNAATKEARVDGKLLSLTLREFGILEYFLRQPNQVLTRDQILSHVWDFSFDSFSNVVDVHVKNLRKKLGATHGKALETLRGVGYRLKI